MVSVTVVEAPDVPIVGVGEGTWPTMRTTLQTIGLDEAEFLAACDGAFKQASRFDGWVDGIKAPEHDLARAKALIAEAGPAAKAEIDLSTAPVFDQRIVGQHALRTALVQPIGWEQDWTPLYEALANDFVYPDPDALVVFAENHDTSRLLAHVDGDLDLWKTGMAWLATVRGTPQFYYGSEVLLRGPKERNDGLLRADMPGGWANDKANAFTGAALSAKQRDAQDYIRTLFNWRKRSPVLHAGKLTHYAPDDGIYVYFRHDGKHTVMVALNRNAEAKPLALDRFARFLADTAGARDALTGKPVRLGKTLQVPAKAAVLLEIRSQPN